MEARIAQVVLRSFRDFGNEGKGGQDMMRNVIVMVVTILVASGAVLAIPVGTVFTEDFEAQTAGINNFPTPNAAPAPFWVAGSQNYWGGGGIWGAPYVAEAVHANPGKMYMVYLAADANTAYDNWGASSAWQFATGIDVHPEEMILSFDMFVREYSGGLGPRISLVDADSGDYATFFL